MSGHLVRSSANSWRRIDPIVAARELASLLGTARGGMTRNHRRTDGCVRRISAVRYRRLRGKRSWVQAAADESSSLPTAGLADISWDWHGGRGLHVVIRLRRTPQFRMYSPAAAQIMASAGISAMVLPRALRRPFSHSPFEITLPPQG